MLLLATTNPGKLEELRGFFAPWNLVTVSAGEYGDLREPEEQGRTFAENARLKAEYYFRTTGLPSLADDSGLMVDALGGEPGVHSARYASTDAGRIEKLLRQLASLQLPAGMDSRTARFVCALCLYTGSRMVEVEGIVEGRILQEPRGSHGFGYDPVFWYPNLGKTFAELTTREKNRVSHRALALEHLRQQMTGELLQELEA